MKPFHEHLADLLIAQRLYSRADQKRWLSQKTKVSNEAARKWLIGDNVPSPENMDCIAKGLGIPLAQLHYQAPGVLATAESRPTYAAFPIRTDEDHPQDGDVEVMVADIELAAGHGVDAPTFVEAKYRHTYRADWLREMRVRDPSALVTCRVRGASMERVLFHGDKVLVDTLNKAIEEDGVYALVMADQLKVKRLRRRSDGGLQIVSDNPDYPTEQVAPDELDSLHIVGRVIDKSGPGGLYRI